MGTVRASSDSDTDQPDLTSPSSPSIFPPSCNQAIVFGTMDGVLLRVRLGLKDGYTLGKQLVSIVSRN